MERLRGGAAIAHSPALHAFPRPSYSFHRLGQKDFLLIEDNYGRNVVDLTLARGNLKKLLDNSRVARYLAERHRELLPELQRVVDAAALDT